MAGTLKVGGNIIATHTGVEGAGQVSLTNVSLGGGAFMFRNKFINGNQVVDQRNNGSAGTASANTITYSTDRWYIYSVGATCGYQRVAGPNTSDYAIQITPASSNTNSIVAQRIENLNCLDLSNQTVTISGKAYIDNASGVTFNTNVYVASSANSSYGSLVSFSSNLTSGQYVDFSGTVTLGANAINGIEVDFSFLSAAGKTIKLTNLQLEIGTAATPFEHRPISIEKSLCYRYYYRMTANPVAVTVSGTTTTNASYIGFAVGRAYSVSAGTAIIFLPEPLRTSPPVFNYSPISGNNWDYNLTDMSLVNRQLADTRTVAIYASISVAQSQSSWLLSTGNIGSGSSSTDSVFMDFSAEL